MEEWKISFRDIYGRSPTSSDYDIAPAHIKVNLKSEKKKVEKEKKVNGRGVKRKNFEMKMMDGEQFSPVKKRMSFKTTTPIRISPRKKEFSLDDFGSPSKPNPKKPTFFDASPIKCSPKKILTPSRRQFNFDDLSPLKAPSNSISTGFTPIKSPMKKSYQRKLDNKELEMLLLPTPEKVEEDYVDFQDETTDEISAMRSVRAQRSLSGNKKKPDMNFQKINLRKKQFVRGKVTAEQKRKMKRKQMFRNKSGVS